MENERATALNRISFVIVLLFAAALAVTAMTVVTGAADADDKVVAHRDSGPGHDGDGDDDDNSGPGGGDGDDDRSGPGDGDGDTATGTTAGTGASNTGTNDTA